MDLLPQPNDFYFSGVTETLHNQNLLIFIAFVRELLSRHIYKEYNFWHLLPQSKVKVELNVEKNVIYFLRRA